MQYPLPSRDSPAGYSQPPREPTIKTGIRKPGSDVKGAPVSYGSPNGPERSMLPLILLGLVLAALAMYFFFANQAEELTDSEYTTMVQEPVRDESGICVVDVATDIAGGELFVDGESYGPLDTNADNPIELEDGAYQLEVRLGGSAVRSETVSIESDIRVELMMPMGAGGVDDAPDTPSETDGVELLGEKSDAEISEIVLPRAETITTPIHRTGTPRRPTIMDEPAAPMAATPATHDEAALTEPPAPAAPTRMNDGDNLQGEPTVMDESPTGVPDNPF